MENPLNKFNIYNRTTVYLTDNGSAFYSSVVYDPEVIVDNKSVGIFNNTNNLFPDDVKLNRSFNNLTNATFWLSLEQDEDSIYEESITQLSEYIIDNFKFRFP